MGLNTDSLTKAVSQIDSRLRNDLPEGINTIGNGGPFSISDSNSAIPQDRVFFNYNYFDNTPLATNYADPGGSFELTVTSDQIVAQLDQERLAVLEELAGVAAADGYVPPLRQASPWHAWFSTRFGEEREGPSTARLKSDIAEATAGALIALPDSVSGGYLRFRDAGSNITGELAVDGEAVGGGLFHIRPIGLGLTAHGLVYYELGDADATLGGATGSFDIDAWQVEGEITGTTDFGGWWMTHRANLFYHSIHRDGFVLSTGTPVGSDTDDVLRLSFGPTARTVIHTDGPLGAVSPFVRVEGEWDIDEEDAVLSPLGTLIAPDDFNVRLSAGSASSLGRIGSASVEASWLGGGGGGDDTVEVRGVVTIPLN